MLKFAVSTLGCKVNQYESERIARDFLRNDFKLVDFTQFADVYIINTCMVTNTTEAKSRKIIRRASRRNSNAFIVATGCYAELKPDEIRAIEGVDLVVGNSKKIDLVNLVLKALMITNSIPKEKELLENRHFHTRALVKIQDGCDRFCSYCIIPYARGGLKSRAQSEIVNEARGLAENGIKEIVLTGIHLGKYGWDLCKKDALVELLLELKEVEGIKRIRLSSIELKELTPRLISLIADEPKLCHHVHVPLQSGSNKVLRMMNRDYVVEDFIKTMEKIKNLVPEIALTTDVIVGFPGETEDCFQETVSMVKKVGFRKLHVFRFSERSGTKAAEMPNKISDFVKDRRSRELIKVGEILTENFLNRFPGRKLEVLVEKFNNKNRLLTGLTENYIRVDFEGSKDLCGQIVGVQVSDVRNGKVFGKTVSGSEESISAIANKV